MAAVTFDTLKFTETLEKAGVHREQASAIAVAVRDAHETAELATKSDLRELELRIVIKLGVLMVVGLGVVTTILKL